MKDKEKDLIENDPLKGSQTDRNTQRSDEAQSASFETIAPEKDNPVSREFEIRELGNDELKEDELARYASLDGAPRNNKLSERKFLGTQI
ncbi:hypothetical protein ACQKCJ_03890 [Flavobacterium sp. NPDC079362]|uniref:hypothetical protein n=1 Tax=Flavobacterium sp. NPDC079362 TaxID=3390566 RepID=UPI003D044E7B